MATISEAFDQAVQCHLSGKLAEAEAIYWKIVEADPQHADALHLLGVIASQQGKHDRAVQFMEKALQLQPSNPAFHSNLGEAYRLQGRLAEAVDQCRQALFLQPDYVEALNNLGLALHALGGDDVLAEAANCFRRALQLKPDCAEVCNNLGMALQAQGLLTEAEKYLRQALRTKPAYAEAHNNLGNVLQIQNRLREAEIRYRVALSLRPEYAVAANNLGEVLQAQGRLEEAVEQFHRALSLQPHYADACNNLGSALVRQGLLKEGMARYQEALRLNPDHVQAHSNLIFAMHFHPDCDAAAILEECRRWDRQHARKAVGGGQWAVGSVRAGAPATGQQAVSSDLVSPIENRKSQIGTPLPAAHGPLPTAHRFWGGVLPVVEGGYTNLPDPERCLRIGYVSPDFRNHCQALFTIPLFSNHDRRQVVIYCYAEVPSPDAITARLRDLADGWRSTVGRSDTQIDNLIRNDQIDILVDLTMHMADNRLLLFARKPAPIQVSWLAYPGTTGLTTIDYRLTDPYLDPPGQHDDWYSEESVRLPDTFWCYDPLMDGPPVNDLPASRNGVVTFGCLNNFSKINDGVLTLWAKVLRSVPRSRLLLLAPQGRCREHVLAVLEQQGVASPFIEFVELRPRKEYLALYQRIDLALDPFPYNGHTTSLDGFWMGIPTITLVGKTAVGRAGWSLLCNLGLPELAAQTPEKYVEIAAGLATDLPRLQALRSTLRKRLCASPLMDAKRFASNIEKAYREMWRRWCRMVRGGPASQASAPC